MGVTCGVFCGCGTAKVELSKPHAEYPHPFIYVAVHCQHILDKDVQHKKIWQLEELKIDEHGCFWTEMPMNKFDTHGLPFYILSDKDDKL
jgi:hypothetical protein